MKKLTAIFLALVMLFGLMACAAKPAAETAAETAAEPAAETAAEPSSETENAPADAEEDEAWKQEHPTWLCEDKATITIMTHDSETGLVATGNNAYFWQWMEEMTNVHVEWDIIPNASYADTSRARIAAAEDLPDIIQMESPDSATLQSLYDNDLIVDLAEYWDTCFPYTDDYWKTQNTRDPYMESITDADGKILGLKNATNGSSGWGITALWNMHWLNEVGIDKAPETLDEAYDAMVKMKEAGDLNHNGENDEVILTGVCPGYLIYYFGNAFGHFTDDTVDYTLYQVDDAGKIYDTRISDEMHDTLQFLNKLYNEGMIDRDIFANPWDFEDAAEKCANSRMGVNVTFTGYATNYGDLINRYYDPDVANNVQGVYCGLALASEHNNNQHFDISGFTTYNATVVKNGENKELCMKWLDFLFASPEALRELAYGPEGIGYEMNEAGEPELIYDEEGNWINVGDYGCGQIPLCWIQTDEIIYNDKKNVDWYYDFLNYRTENSTFIELPIKDVAKTEEETFVYDTYWDTIYSYWSEMSFNLITAGDFETSWNDYVQMMKDLGIDELTEGVYQSRYDRTK